MLNFYLLTHNVFLWDQCQKDICVLLSGDLGILIINWQKIKSVAQKPIKIDNSEQIYQYFFDSLET